MMEKFGRNLILNEYKRKTIDLIFFRRWNTLERDSDLQRKKEFLEKVCCFMEKVFVSAKLNAIKLNQNVRL